MSMLTDEEKVRIRHHTGYPNAARVATTVLGMPSSIETFFIIELAMESVRVEALTQVRRHLDILDVIETQMVDDLELLAVSQVDEITIRPDEHAKLTNSYLYWRDSLCNLFGIEANRFDARFAGGTGINVKVNH